MADAPKSFRDPLYAELAANTERQVGLPVGMLSAVITHGERSNADQVSSAGARTVAQIIPATREAALKKYGIDAYLSPQNALEVAGRLLKESLDRNKGDEEAAVREYHGGTDRKNWGPVNDAYWMRVSAGMGEAKAGAMGGDFAAWMSKNPAVPEKPAAAAPAQDKLGNDFAAWLGGGVEIPGQTPGAVTLPGDRNVGQPQPEPSLADRAIGAGEAVLTTATGMTGGAIGMAGGLAKGVAQSILNGTFGDRQAADLTEQYMAEGANALTYQPRTATGQEYAENVGQVMQQALPAAMVAHGMVPPGAGTAARTAVTDAARAVPGAVADLAGKGVGAVGKSLQAARTRLETAGVLKPQSSGPAGTLEAVRALDAAAAPDAAAPAPAALPSPQPAQTFGPGSVGAAQVANPTMFDEPTGFQPKPKFAGAGQELPLKDQIERAAALREIGLEDARKSSITGNGMAAADEHQMSKLSNGAGEHMKAQFDRERAALNDYTEKLGHETGGTIGLDQGATYERGNTIVEPLDRLGEWFDSHSRELYAEADRRAKGVPVPMGDVSSVINDKSTLTNSDRVHLRAAFRAYAEKLGMVDDKGRISGNAQQAETLRKFLNENWSPANSGLVSQLKQAIDNSVMKAAGDDLYRLSRDMWRQRKLTLDNPKGIAAIVDVDPSGINRKVAMERIADNVWGLPKDQFDHVIKTYRGVPDELRPMAEKALAEVKAHFISQLQAAGNKHATQWNSNGVATLLNRNSAKIQTLFTPEEIAKLRTLNTAGHALVKDTGYPGAAAQAHNLAQAGSLHAVRAGVAALGGAIGGAPGAATGALAGNKAAAMLADRAALKAAQKRIVSIKKQPKSGVQGNQPAGRP